MPWPLIPIAAAAAAVLAGGSKIAASFAKDRAERVAREVKAAEATAQAKNLQYAGVRQHWAQVFASQADTARGVYEQYLADNGLSQEEVDLAELPPEVRESLGNLSVLPPPVLNLQSSESGNALIQSSARLSIQGQHLRHNHPRAANALQGMAIAGAVTGYIDSNMEQVKATDVYEGKAREYIAEVTSLVAAFDAAFERDLLEDQRSSQRVGHYVNGLIQQRHQDRTGWRSVAVVSAAAYKAYLDYLVALSGRYSSTEGRVNG